MKKEQILKDQCLQIVGRRTVLCVYGAVRGVGGIDSWGSDVEAAYHIDAESDISYSFVIS